MGGPVTTDTKMPEELFDRRTHVVCSHRNTHPRTQTTPTLTALSRVSAGIIVLLLLSFASGLQKSRRDGRGRRRDKEGSRAGCNEAPPTLRNQRLVAGKQKTQMSL